MKKDFKVATKLARLGLTGAGGLMLVVATSARADIKYTQVMRMGEDAGADKTAQPINSTTKYVRQDAERMESAMQMGPVKMQNITIRLCDKKQTIKLEPRLKLYTIVDDAGSDAGAATDRPAAERPTAAKDDKPTTGKMVITTNVQDLGEEEVAGFKTRHYMLSMRMQSSGCAGDGDTSTKMEIWTSDIRDATPCDKVGPDYKAMMGGVARPSCKIEFEQKGDATAINKAYNGLVLRMKIYNDDKVAMTQEVTMLSQAKLTDDPFTVPADYKQVSEQEFQKAQSRAMMQAMLEQAKNGDANGEDGDKAKDQGGEDKNDADNNKDGDAKDDENKPKPEKTKKRPKIRLPF